MAMLMINDISPYLLYSFQKEVIAKLKFNMEKGIPTMLNAPTGSGKTIISLLSVLDYSFKNNKRILYLVRTKTQEIQVLTELSKIHKKRPVTGIGLQGRSGRCPLFDKKGYNNATYEELSKICNDRKNKNLQKFAKKVGSFIYDEWSRYLDDEPIPNNVGCQYFEKVIELEGKVLEEFTNTVWLPDEFDKYAVKYSFCPYEMSKKLSSYANVVIAPYIFFFNPYIRNNLLRWMGVDLEDIMLIVDEAHNIPDYLREMSSISLTDGLIELAMKEFVNNKFNILKPSEVNKINSIFSVLKAYILSETSSLKDQDDRLLIDKEIENHLMETTGYSIREIQRLVNLMVSWGTYLKDIKRREKVLPRSYVYIVGSILVDLFDYDNDYENGYIHVLTKVPSPSIEIFNLDPSKLAEPIKETHWHLHMSGTLVPMEQYRDILGLEENIDMINIPSHFPLENRIIKYVDNLTTKYEVLKNDSEMFIKIHEVIKNLIKNVVKNTIVFYPSYTMMNKAEVFLKSQIVDRPIFVERRDSDSSVMFSHLNNFRDSVGKGAILLAVSGGKISEGIDLPGKQLEMVIVVGIPYPKPTTKNSILEEYYNKKYKFNGWNYVYEAPAIRKILQSIGRLIRTSTDKGVVIILDNRASIMKKYIPDLALSKNVLEDAKKFFIKAH